MYQQRPSHSIIVILLIFFSSSLVLAQNETQIEYSGYLKNLQSFTVSNDLDNPLTGNIFFNTLFHNYSKLETDFSKNLSLYTGLRTRIYIGDFVRFGTGANFTSFKSAIENADNDIWDLTWVIADRKPTIVHTLLDRAFLRYADYNWEITLGRQRINWGVHSIWNPNDIFNAYSFIDFDYEERRGSDAVRVLRYLGESSSIELAGKLTTNFNENIIGALWKFNKSEFDFQLLAAKYQTDFSVGFGMAGNIKNSILKSEFTSFVATTDSTKSAYIWSIGTEHSTKKGWVLSTGFLFNSTGQSNIPASEIFNVNISARNLYPYRYSFLFQFFKEISPLTSGGIVTVYSIADNHPIFINPTLRVSIGSNWDLDIVSQIIFNKEASFRSPAQSIFLRIKYSY